MQINRQTYEEFFLLYVDNELSAGGKKEVENFIAQNPDLQVEFDLIKQTVMVPDNSIIFANKEVLFKNEESRKVVMMRWFRYAAAAVILLALSVTGWLFLDENKRNTPPVAILEPQKTIEPARNESENIPGNNSTIAEERSTSTTVEKQQRVVKNTAVNLENKIKASSKPQVVENTSTEEPAAVTAPSTEEPGIITSTPDPIEVNNDVVLAEPVTEPIDIEVAPRQMEAPTEQQIPDVHYTQSINEEREKSDMIYFANTSLSKKTKLRGVLRKATRYLERVTSIQ
ncbi:MAG: hypothetical protein JNK79_18260 [Chitinophagaceae bacterium]|nr:hypothetical protein [Chitinophagaceae bacterium]